MRRPALRRDAVHPHRGRRPRRPGVGAARRLVVHGLDQRRDPGAPAVEADDRRGHPGRHEARRRRRPRAAPGSTPSGTSASSGRSGRPSRRATTGSGRWRDVVAAITGEGPRRAADPRDLHRVARRRRERPGAPARGDQARRRRQLVVGEAGDARLGARPDVARHPDAVPGPGAARGSLVRRHRRARLDEGRAATWGILRLHHDLIALRRGGGGTTRGLRGEHIAILRADEKAKLLAFHRWHEGGPGDDVVVVANFADRVVDDLRLGLPAAGSLAGPAERRFAGLRRRTSAATRRSTPRPTTDRTDGFAQSALVSVGPYGVVVLSQDPGWTRLARGRAEAPAPPDGGRRRRRSRRRKAKPSGLGGGADVLVEAEEVGRVVVALDLGQPAVGQVGIRLVDAGLALVLEEVRVDPGRARAAAPRSRPA